MLPGEGLSRGRGQGVYESSVLSAEFYCESKTALKNVYFKREHITTIRGKPGIFFS